MDGLSQRMCSLPGLVSGWWTQDRRNQFPETQFRIRILRRLGKLNIRGHGVRLGRALDATRAGDQRFVASPRADSYHGVWFELHEDLIRLADRTREAEAEAGRA